MQYSLCKQGQLDTWSKGILLRAQLFYFKCDRQSVRKAIMVAYKHVLGRTESTINQKISRKLSGGHECRNESRQRSG